MLLATLGLGPNHYLFRSLGEQRISSWSQAGVLATAPSLLAPCCPWHQSSNLEPPGLVSCLPRGANDPSPVTAWCSWSQVLPPLPRPWDCSAPSLPGGRAETAAGSELPNHVLLPAVQLSLSAGLRNIFIHFSFLPKNILSTKCPRAEPCQGQGTARPSPQLGLVGSGPLPQVGSDMVHSSIWAGTPMGQVPSQARAPWHCPSAQRCRARLWRAMRLTLVQRDPPLPPAPKGQLRGRVLPLRVSPGSALTCCAGLLSVGPVPRDAGKVCIGDELSWTTCNSSCPAPFLTPGALLIFSGGPTW